MSSPSAFTSGIRSKTRLIALAAAVVVALAGAAYVMLTAKNPAPNVVFTSLTGEKVALHALRGKVVLVNFWATSCVFCVHEMPQMVRTYNQYKSKGLEFFAVAMSYDPPNLVLNYAQTRNLPFTVALDLQDELAQAFGGVGATPTTFVIGKDGNIITHFQGEPDFDHLHRLLDKALAVRS